MLSYVYKIINVFAYILFCLFGRGLGFIFCVNVLKANWINYNSLFSIWCSQVFIVLRKIYPAIPRSFFCKEYNLRNIENLLLGLALYASRLSYQFLCSYIKSFQIAQARVELAFSGYEPGVLPLDDRAIN